MGHSVTMWPEWPIRSWVLSDPSTHEVGGAHQQSIIKRKYTGHIHDLAWEGPESTSKFIKKLPKSLQFLLLLQSLPFKSMPSWNVSYDQSTEEEIRAWLIDDSVCNAGTTQDWTAATLELISGTTLKNNRWRKVFTVDRTLGSAFFLEREMAKCDYR